MRMNSLGENVMPKKVKQIKVDGFGPDDKRKIRAALRKVWSWSYPRRLVEKRCLIDGGFSRCEKCKKKCPKVYVDHIQNVGEVDAGFISRLFVASHKMQGLCKKCHDAKTKLERSVSKLVIKDFY